MIDVESRIYDSRDDVKKLILSVINGEVKEVELPFNNLKHYIDICEALGLSEEEIELDDLYFTVSFYDCEEKEFVLCGDMYDSKTLNFSILE